MLHKERKTEIYHYYLLAATILQQRLQRINFLEVLVLYCTPKASFPVLSAAGMSSSTSPTAAVSQRPQIPQPEDHSCFLGTLSQTWAHPSHS